MPCSASGMAQPRTTSSTVSGRTAGTRSRAARMAAAAMSSGRVCRSVPLGALPTAVRTLATITASRREGPGGLAAGLGTFELVGVLVFFGVVIALPLPAPSVPERPAVLQHVLD